MNTQADPVDAGAGAADGSAGAADGGAAQHQSPQKQKTPKSKHGAKTAPSPGTGTILSTLT